MTAVSYGSQNPRVWGWVVLLPVVLCKHNNGDVYGGKKKGRKETENKTKIPNRQRIHVLRMSVVLMMSLVGRVSGLFVKALPHSQSQSMTAQPSSCPDPDCPANQADARDRQSVADDT